MSIAVGMGVILRVVLAAIVPPEGVPAGLDGFHPLGLIAEGDAGRLKPVGLLLHPSGIGQQAASVFKGF